MGGATGRSRGDAAGGRVTAGDAPSRDVVFVRGLRLSMAIGVEPSERGRRQAVVVDVRMEVDPSLRAGDYVSYAPVVEHLLALAEAGRHVDLVEEVAEIAAAKALEDPGVLRVEVTVEKPDIFPEADAVGVIVARTR